MRPHDVDEDVEFCFDMLNFQVDKECENTTERIRLHSIKQTNTHNDKDTTSQLNKYRWIERGRRNQSETAEHRTTQTHRKREWESMSESDGESQTFKWSSVNQDLNSTKVDRKRKKDTDSSKETKELIEPPREN